MRYRLLERCGSTRRKSSASPVRPTRCAPGIVTITPRWLLSWNHAVMPATISWEWAHTEVDNLRAASHGAGRTPPPTRRWGSSSRCGRCGYEAAASRKHWSAWMPCWLTRVSRRHHPRCGGRGDPASHSCGVGGHRGGPRSDAAGPDHRPSTRQPGTGHPGPHRVRKARVLQRRRPAVLRRGDRFGPVSGDRWSLCQIFGYQASAAFVPVNRSRLVPPLNRGATWPTSSVIGSSRGIVEPGCRWR